MINRKTSQDTGATEAAIVAIGVAIFPLYLGGGIPVWHTVALVFASECALYLVGYAVLRKTPLMELAK